MSTSSQHDPPHASGVAGAAERPAGYTIRRAAGPDMATIARHRRAMFEDLGATTDLDAVERAFAAWLPARLDATYFHWLADHEGDAIASAGILLLDWPPSPRDPRGGLGFVYNVYVAPVHRRRGLARALMLALHEWAQARGLGAVALHASEHGRPLYEALGYLPTNEMRIDFLAIARGEWPAPPIAPPIAPPAGASAGALPESLPNARGRRPSSRG
jgi:GNAT superfamily N-acetyltransferase